MSTTAALPSTALGVTVHSGGGTFRIYSANATSVQFVIVDEVEVILRGNVIKSSQTLLKTC